MPSQSTGRPAPSFDCDAETARRFRNRGLANLLRMGHCAPSIMQAMLDVFELDAQWLVKLMAGMHGGIGYTGGECGGVTAPLEVKRLRVSDSRRDRKANEAHESPRATKLRDRTNDAISLDQIERILI